MMVPASGLSRAAMRWSSVDLPQPDGPTTATHSPAATFRSRPSRARTRPSSNVFTTPYISTTNWASLIAQRLHRRQADRSEGRIGRARKADDDGHDQRPHEDVQRI